MMVVMGMKLMMNMMNECSKAVRSELNWDDGKGWDEIDVCGVLGAF
jgi:hypothetical protein